MTREQYESLPLAQLKAIAKTRGMKGTSTLKKGELITLMLEKDEEASRQEQIAQAERIQKERQERYEQRQEQRAERAERTERTERAERTERPNRYVRTERLSYERNGSGQAQTAPQPQQEQPTNLDSGQVANGILEVLVDGYGFIRSDN